MRMLAFAKRASFHSFLTSSGDGERKSGSGANSLAYLHTLSYIKELESRSFLCINRLDVVGEMRQLFVAIARKTQSNDDLTLANRILLTVCIVAGDGAKNVTERKYIYDRPFSPSLPVHHDYIEH